MPERGASPFPTIEADAYRSYSTGIRGKGAEGDTMQVDWERLKEEIKPMQAQLGREHIAFYSQYDPDSDQYTYSPHGLIFSEEAVARADGKSGLILYEIQHPESKHLNKLVLINAPISRQAIDEMRIWARGSGSSSGQQKVRYTLMSNSVSGNPEQECDSNPDLWECEFGDIIVTPEEDWMDDPFFDHDSFIEEEDDGGGGLYPPQPGDSECHVVLGCGGGVGDGNNGDDDVDFLGDIIIDDSILDNPKAKCVLDGLLEGETNTLSETIVKFADESVNIDLVIELADLPNTTLGDLVSSNQSNTFNLRLNENRISDRKPIEIATTYLHEAIHAEMRRYLYGAMDTSTLPGFPGDFASDWILFLEINYGKNEEGISDAEHEVMAVKYRNIIVDGLKEFFDSNFTQSDYEAIAWIGLEETKYYKQILTPIEQESIEDEIQDAKSKATSTCD